ncbi:MAG TPA: hypothetical protein PLT26_11525 [Anaerolineaceae bacterium]|nr:hypothetical protein [Anaerolineaceae bacterium]HQH86108.1 hypothetical protein [Anaerolineaceae bacterium]
MRLVELIQGGQQPMQVAVEAVNLIHHNHLKAPGLRIGHQPFQRRAVAVFLGRQPRIGVYLNHLPALLLGIGLNIDGLRIQAVPIHLFTHRYPPVTGSALDIFHTHPPFFGYNQVAQ